MTENSCLSIDLSPVFGECDHLDHRKKKINTFRGLFFVVTLSCQVWTMQVIKITTNHFVLSRPAEDLGNRSLLDVRGTSGSSSLFIYFVLFFCVWLCLESFSGLTCLFVGWTLVRIHLMVSPWHSQSKRTGNVLQNISRDAPQSPGTQLSLESKGRIFSLLISST